MENRIFNFKWLLLLLVPVLGIAVSVCFLVFSQKAGIYMGLALLLISLIAIAAWLFVEPVTFIVDAQGITSVGVFKRCFTAWKQIAGIQVCYDPVFYALFIKDYVFSTDGSCVCPYRFLRIVNCGKTRALLRRYAPVRLTDGYQP